MRGIESRPRPLLCPNPRFRGGRPRRAFAWHKQNRIDKAQGKVNYFPALEPEGKPGVMGQEAYDWFMDNNVEKRAPTYRNQVTVESLEIGMNYDPTATLHLISPTPKRRRN